MLLVSTINIILKYLKNSRQSRIATAASFCQKKHYVFQSINSADHLSGQFFFQFQTFNPMNVNPNGGPEHFITALIVKLPRTQKLHLPEMNKLVDYDYYQ